MAKGINRVTLVGYLGQEPKIFREAEIAVAKLSLATSEEWTDKLTGEEKKQTEWHRVTLFGKLADVAEKFLHTGSLIFVEGQLQTHRWKDQRDIDRYTTEIVVKHGGTMQMLGQATGTQSELLASSPIDFDEDA